MKKKSRRCQALTKKGVQCKNIARENGCCAFHQHKVIEKPKNKKDKKVTPWLEAATSLVSLINEVEKYAPDILYIIDRIFKSTRMNQFVPEGVTHEELKEEIKKRVYNRIKMSIEHEEEFPLRTYTLILKIQFEHYKNKSGSFQNTDIPESLYIELLDTCDNFLRLSTKPSKKKIDRML